MQIGPIHRFQQLLPEINTVQFHHYGGVTICAPQVVVTAGDVFNQRRGTLAVAVQETKGTTLCFIPCGGPEAETRIGPNRVQGISLKEICRIDKERLPKRRGELLAKVELTKPSFRARRS